MTDLELETFKGGIDLRAYAALGYAWDRKEIWRGSTVMRETAPPGSALRFSKRAISRLAFRVLNLAG